MHHMTGFRALLTSITLIATIEKFSQDCPLLNKRRSYIIMRQKETYIIISYLNWPNLTTKINQFKEIWLFKDGCTHFNMHIFTFNWLTLTSEMHFVKFHPEVASCLLSRGKRKYAPLGMRLLWKYIRNYFLVYRLISHFLLYLQNYKEFEAEILDLQ